MAQTPVLFESQDDDIGSTATGHDILRFGTIYDLSPRPRFDLVINTLAARAVYEKRITIFGGDQWRPFIHVDDAAAAILKCLEAPSTPSRARSSTQQLSI